MAGEIYDVRTDQSNQQIPTSYNVGDYVTVYSPSGVSGEVILGVSAVVPRDWVIRSLPQVGQAPGSTATFVAVADTYESQVASFTIDVVIGKVT